ncbi:MAG: VWA domain-containing protein [Acidobacteriota bacterium]|nr:VWA domain-containing protein [Acidobacteriota bacterium]
MRRELLTRVTISLFVWTALAGGAQEGPPDDYLFSEVIDVRLVNVEVWVTDAKGTPVSGLSAADFEILEDGRPVEISYFAEIRESVPVAPTPAVDAREVPPAPQIAVPPDPSHLVVYFDELHLSPAGRRRAIKDLSNFLVDRKVPSERVLILSQDRDLRTEATFGSTWGELDATLERVAKALPRGGGREAQKRLAIRNLQDTWKWAREVAASRPGSDAGEAICDLFVPRAVPEVEIYAAESRERIAVTLDHLGSTAAFLTGVPGVKTLIYVSDALERAPGTDLIKFVSDLCPVNTNTPMFLLSDELSQEFRRLTRHANANRVTIYSLQASGLAGNFLIGAEQAGLESPGILGSFDVALRMSEREGLSTLAAETGGRTIFNTNNFEDDFRQIALEMSSYYSLAYEPPHRGDEREHEIEVRVKSKNLRARHRRGYRDKNPDVRMTERLQGAVYLGLVDNPLDVRLGAGTVSGGAKGGMIFPLHILLPADKIVFLPQDEGVVAQLSVQVSTRNTQDQKGIFDHRAYRINWKTASDQELVSLAVDLEVPPGVHLVAVGVRDDATRETSFVSTTVEVHGVAPASGAG